MEPSVQWPLFRPFVPSTHPGISMFLKSREPGASCFSADAVTIPKFLGSHVSYGGESPSSPFCQCSVLTWLIFFVVVKNIILGCKDASVGKCACCLTHGT